MKTEQLSIRRSDLRDALLARLRGRVFHRTSPESFEKISQGTHIFSNQDERFEFTFPQSKIGWGRQQGYVCLYDLRHATDKQIRDGDWKSGILRPMAFLFLDETHHHKLIPWTAAPPAAMVVPHVEAWYPGDLPVSAISETLVVTCVPDDAESLMRAALKSATDPELLSGTVRLEGPTVAELAGRVEEVVAIAVRHGFEIEDGWNLERVEQDGPIYSIDIRLERHSG